MQSPQPVAGQASHLIQASSPLPQPQISSSSGNSGSGTMLSFDLTGATPEQDLFLHELHIVVVFFEITLAHLPKKHFNFPALIPGIDKKEKREEGNRGMY